MSKMYSSVLTLGDEQKRIAVINYDPENSRTTQIKQMHHIQVLDRSGSMLQDIHKLIENVKQTIEHIPAGDYISIIWFSSPDECSVLLKGAQPGPQIYPMLDSIKSVLSTTCFSRPMQEVGQIINDLKMICPNFAVTLFTDGCPVAPWGPMVEMERTHEAVRTWENDVIALHTIGYGYYYDQQFLRDLSNHTAFGQFVHSNQINEYFDIFSRNYEITSDLVLENVEVHTAEDTGIVYLTSKSATGVTENFSTRALDSKKNQIILIGSDEKDFSFTINGDEFSTAGLPEVPARSITPVTYAIAYTQYYNGHRKEAISILAKQLHDRYLVDQARNAFTYDEVAAYTKLIRKAVFTNQGRMINGACDADYVPSDHAPCIMDILKILTNSGTAKYLYSQNYNRIGVKVNDDFNLFKPDKGDVLTPISELVFHRSRLNISIRSAIPGTVKLNPRRAKQVGLPDTIQSKIYRTQTLIKDGRPNMQEVSFVVDDKVLLDIKILLGNHYDQVVNVTASNPNENWITINLSVLPVINYSYVGDCTDCSHLLKEVHRLTYNQAAQKILNSMLEDCYAYRKKNGIFDTTKQMMQYTTEQVAVLQEHGLNDRAEYVGVNNVAEPSGDSYVARELDFQLKGYSTLPPIDKLKQKITADKKLNGPETMMKDAMGSAQAMLHMLEYGSNQYLDSLKLILQTVKSNLANSRVAICSQKIALVLTGEWFSGVEVDAKGNYLYTEGDQTLVIKATRQDIPL